MQRHKNLFSLLLTLFLIIGISFQASAQSPVSSTSVPDVVGAMNKASAAFGSFTDSALYKAGVWVVENFRGILRAVLEVIIGILSWIIKIMQFFLGYL